MAETILIVDDEKDLVDTLAYNLRDQGYQTRYALTGADALDALAQTPAADLILLDLMLPDMSGTEICRRVRQRADLESTPVIMLTARGDEIDRVVGFEVGADDYVVKPFSMRELMLRVDAVIRRSHTDQSTTDRSTTGEATTGEAATGEAEPADETLEYGRLVVDVAGHRVWVDDQPCELTALEFDLLTTFMRRKGRAQTREILLADVWDITADVVTRTVDTHIKRLRNKLGPAADYIETIRGVGYRFTDTVDS